MPTISSDRRAVVFAMSTKQREVECAIARSAFEEFFWLPRGADDTRTLKVFKDGVSRITAIAHRIMVVDSQKVPIRVV
jgi:hypothetical protein